MLIDIVHHWKHASDVLLLLILQHWSPFS